ncbi:GNAT family N-acetyltransferase [Paractinoplanes hotanensis]|uniref:GNAT family N-acetyltransferase n=1 Tax=Paractinoplanes hotanensis TaxID=2906497 RepID=A0ABT0XX00_9ACTN|nr:GNAT family N-acetyltransferase [Actinoplanes hotanensis]MCM4078294.1 GNAT family N-acetyltransferase [Actinoplanes hotanensis]
MSSTSPGTVPDLRTATEQDIDLVADIVADAFLHLDVIRYLVPNPARRRPVSRAWYRLYIAHAITGAGHVTLTADGTAAAVWFDRTGQPSEPDGYAKYPTELAGDDLPQFQHLDAVMDAHHPSDAHWHLLFLAVRPRRWSQGLGSRLMDYTHARLDAEDIPAYLEATGEQNRALYQRHGYTDMNPPTIAVTDQIPLYRMWRPAGQPEPHSTR